MLVARRSCGTLRCMFPRTTTLIVMATIMLPSTARGQDAAKRLHALFEERHQWRLDNFPEDARMRGDYRGADRITDSSLTAIERRHSETQAHLAKLGEIDRAGLGEDDQISYDLFELDLRTNVEGHRFRMFLAPLG